MNWKPTCKLWHKLTTGISIAAAAWMFWDVFCMWKIMPERLPSHYNAMGQPDAYGGKSTAFALPVVAAVLLTLMLFFRRKPQHWNFPVPVTEENRDRLYGLAYDMLHWLALAVMLIFAPMQYCVDHSLSLSVWFAPATIAAVFGILLVYTIRMVKTQKRRNPPC